MSTTNPIAKFKDPAELKKAGKEIAKNAGGETVLAFFNQNKGTIEAVLPKHISPDRMLKIAMGALRTTPKLMQCTIQSLLGAVVQCAQLGLEPNTPMGHVYLIPFEKKKKERGEWIVAGTEVQIVIGYRGMLDLARRSGQIVSISAHEVCRNDQFDYSYGLDEHLHHRPAMDERGDVIAFYAVAKLKDGGHSFEVMSRHQVETIRDNSQGYKAALISAERYKKNPDTPWVNHFVEMGRKTVTRRLFKWLPMSIEMATAVALDDHSEMGKSQALDNVLSGEFSVDDGEGPLLGYEDQPEADATDAEADDSPLTAPETSNPAVPSYAEVAKALQAAGTLDALHTAADQIRDIENKAHRHQLEQLYNQREAQLKV
jgi:recombination protein RecT